MDHDQIELCRRRIAEEDRLALEAAAADRAAAHSQLALLYKAQLRILLKRGSGDAANDGGDPIAA